MLEDTIPTQGQLASEFRTILEQLDQFSHQAVAHRRKFQFACSQFKQFTETFDTYATNDELTQEQIDAYKFVYKSAKELQELFNRYSLQCWVHFALEQRSSEVPTELCTIAAQLKEHTACLCEDASRHFDSNAPQWLQYHILDIRAIHSSFSKYINRPAAENTDTQMIQQMGTRLHSIDDFLKQYQRENASSTDREVSPIPVHYQSWRLNYDDLTLEQEVGNGVSAIVYFGHHKKTGKQVAVKKLNFKKLSGGKLLTFQREITILALAQHPTILSFIGATDTPPFCIVTEWMPNNSLYHDIHKYHRLDATMKTIAMFDIARGMQFLHSRNIIHRDLKTLNVLIDKDLYIRICDFGFSRQQKAKNDVMTKNIGTPHWMAPELLDGQSPYDNKVDVYAYAIVFWELLSGKLPYQGLNPTQVIAQVMVNDMRPTIPANASEEVTELIKSSWSREPQDRPTFTEIIRLFRQHRIYFDGADKERVDQYVDSIDFSGIESEIEQIESLATNHENNTLQAITDFVIKSQTGGAPRDVIEKCWTTLHTFESYKNGKLSERHDYAKCLVSFLNTSYIMKASEELRQMPSESIPHNIMKDILLPIPTGMENVDTNLVVVACKNKSAVDAALRTENPKDLKLALEISAQQIYANAKGVQKADVTESLIDRTTTAEKLESLSDRCVQVLSHQDPMLNVSAIRCLVGINKASKIPIETLKIFMQSKNCTLKLATHIAAAEMALEGVQLPLDLIDALIAKWTTEPLAPTVLIAGCNNKEIAKHLINTFNYGTTPPPEIALKIINAAANHKELSDILQTTILRLLDQNIPPDMYQQLQRILPTLQP